MRNDIKNVNYANVGERTTVCVLTMQNGFEVLGSFTCKVEMIDNKEFREQKAYDVAIKNLERNDERRRQRFQER